MTAAQVPPGGRKVHRFTVAERIRAARDDVGWDQQQLADATGISRNTISNYERGAHVPRRPQLLAIAMATGFDLQWLETGEEASSDDPPPGHARTDVLPFPQVRGSWDEALAALLFEGVAA